MPTRLQEPKKGGFEISLATDLYSCCSQVSPPLNHRIVHSSCYHGTFSSAVNTKKEVYIAQGNINKEDEASDEFQ